MRTSTARKTIDTDAINLSADILRIIPNSAQLRRAASTGGGEFDGPCWYCGGEDRFHCQPNHPRGGRGFCRQCHGADNWQDAIGLYMWVHGTQFLETCKRLRDPYAVRSAPVQVQAVEPPAENPYRSPWAPHKVTAFYDYSELSSSLGYQKLRIEPGFKGKKKDFWHRRPRAGVLNPRNDHDEDWVFGRGNLERPLIYNLQALHAAAVRAIHETDIRAWILDGEKDCNSATADGLIATCPPDGWSTWPDYYSGLFVGLHAIIVPDREPGADKEAERIARMIYPYAETVRVLDAQPGDA